MGSEALKFYSSPKLKDPVLIVAWSEDASKVGIRSADYLIRSTGCRETGEILPEGFFPMAGVSVDDDVAQFPESKFFAGDARNLLIFKSNLPRFEWHEFVNCILDAAREFKVREIYTLGAMVSTAAHTMPRMLISIVNETAIKPELEPFNVVTNTDYETPPGQKPTMSSYLLWLAKQRALTAVSLWVPVPYYLVPVEDPRAYKRFVYFFNSKFNLGVDFTRIDADIAEQDRMMADLFAKSPDIQAMVRKLEAGEGLDTADSEKLATEVLEFLKK